MRNHVNNPYKLVAKKEDEDSNLPSSNGKLRSPTTRLTAGNIVLVVTTAFLFISLAFENFNRRQSIYSPSKRAVVRQQHKLYTQNTTQQSNNDHEKTGLDNQDHPNKKMVHHSYPKTDNVGQEKISFVSNDNHAVGRTHPIPGNMLSYDEWHHDATENKHKDHKENKIPVKAGIQPNSHNKDRKERDTQDNAKTKTTQQNHPKIENDDLRKEKISHVRTKKYGVERTHPIPGKVVAYEELLPDDVDGHETNGHNSGRGRRKHHIRHKHHRPHHPHPYSDSYVQSASRRSSDPIFPPPFDPRFFYPLHPLMYYMRPPPFPPQPDYGSFQGYGVQYSPNHHKQSRDNPLPPMNPYALH